MRSPSNNVLNAFIARFDVATGSSALAIYWAACNEAPLSSRAAASGSTSMMKLSFCSLPRLSVIERMHSLWDGQVERSQPIVQRDHDDPRLREFRPVEQGDLLLYRRRRIRHVSIS
jgi:hypothetical protein